MHGIGFEIDQEDEGEGDPLDIEWDEDSDDGEVSLVPDADFLPSREDIFDVDEVDLDKEGFEDIDVERELEKLGLFDDDLDLDIEERSVPDPPDPDHRPFS